MTDSNGRTDPILVPFLTEADERRRDGVLSGLIGEHAAPLIDRAVRTILPDIYRCDQATVDDIKAEIVLRLIQRLECIRANPKEEAPNNFASYVAVTSYNSCHDFLRRKNPERWRLKKRIRYALSHGEGFVIWRRDRVSWLCGLLGWASDLRPCSGPQLAELLRESGLRGSATRAQHLSPASLLRSIFKLSAAPVELDDLVEAICEILGVENRQPVELSTLDDHNDPRRTVQLVESVHPIESALTARHLWRKLCTLPQQQRLVLILGMTDEQGLDAVSLLGNARVASLEEISAVVGLGTIELAGMWDQLPLDDDKTARFLGLSKQRVVDLRRSARRRLARAARIRPRQQTGNIRPFKDSQALGDKVVGTVRN